MKSKLEMHTVKRLGSGYNELKADEYVSAAYLREHIKNGGDISQFVPAECAEIYAEQLRDGNAHEFSNLERCILSFFRLADPTALSQCVGISGGLEYRLCTAAKESADFDEFFEKRATKK